MIKAEVEYIDPARARDLLGHMALNRNIRKPKVAKYAADMRAGRWRLTGEAIKLTSSGEVIDGEHRLRAVAKSGATIQSLVIYGVELDDRVAMDTGASRTLADHLRFRGEKYFVDLGTALPVLYSRHRHSCLRNLDASHQELLRELEEHPTIRDSVRAIQAPAKHLRLPRGICAALHYDMTAINDSDANLFWERLYTGAGLNEHDPIGLLRHKLEERALARGRKVDTVIVHALIIKAWNAYREGREMSHLRWVRGGAKPEAFPELA